MTNRPNRPSFCSAEPVTDENLRRLVDLGLQAFELRAASKPDTAGLFRGRMFSMCLCQGAALHRLAGERLVHDFDVWCFFDLLPDGSGFKGVRFPRVVDFGPSEHGRDPEAPARFKGRKVDVWFRSFGRRPDETPVSAVRRYLTDRRSESARYLAARPVIALWPEPDFGRIVWSLDQVRPYP